MAHAHRHGRLPQSDRASHFEGGGPPVDHHSARRLRTATVICGLLTLFGLIVLWPRGDLPSSSEAESLFSERVKAEVTSTAIEPCSYDVGTDCHQVTIRIRSGPRAGEDSSWENAVESTIRPFDTGDRMYVYETTLDDGRTIYSFADYQRNRPLIVLGVMFVAAVLLLARWKGLGAITGLAVSLVVLVVFVLPSLLRGNNAIAVALVGSGAIAFVVLYLAHGVKPATTVALLSTFASLTLIGLLSWLFVTVSKFTGFTEDSSFALSALGVQFDGSGLLLAGIVIGSLGVLDDVTVTQVSAVWELRQLQPSATRSEIYRSAVNIGRDHISSTVNTLFLTYAGAALPLMLLFAVAGQSISTVATSEVVATEIVRSLVGSIGLVASVPISTWLATRVLDAGSPSRRTDAPT